LITINRPLDVVEPSKIRDGGFHGGRCEVHIVNPWNWYTTLRVKVWKENA